MPKFDRLTTLINRFRLTATPAAPAAANLAVLSGANGRPAKIVFLTREEGVCGFGDALLLPALSVSFGGPSNPLVLALPPMLEVDVTDDPEMESLILLMQSEMKSNRCGAVSVLNRLAEVLIVRLLRDQIERGSAEPGLLSGLSHPTISRAIVAIHDDPGRAWKNADLAAVAGLSASRFNELFHSLVGEAPASYLRRWRLILARQDLWQGGRVDAVARRYGYGSADGFTRAFRRHFGESPITVRQHGRI